MYKTDIKFLLDKVYSRVVEGAVPDADLYVFLTDVCAPNDVPEVDIQAWCRELLLGNTADQALNTSLLYPTKITGGGGGGEEKREALVEVSMAGRVRPKYSPDRLHEFRGLTRSELATKAGGTSGQSDAARAT